MTANLIIAKLLNYIKKNKDDIIMSISTIFFLKYIFFLKIYKC